MCVDTAPFCARAQAPSVNVAFERVDISAPVAPNVNTALEFQEWEKMTEDIQFYFQLSVNPKVTMKYLEQNIVKKQKKKRCKALEFKGAVWWQCSQFYQALPITRLYLLSNFTLAKKTLLNDRIPATRQRNMYPES